jgi:hypothetical protein
MRESKAASRESEFRAESAALDEVEWFYRCAGGRVPRHDEMTATARTAAASIAGWLGALATFHGGAFSLRFTPREWPALITAEFDGWTSLIVRLECASHPGDGDTSALEMVAVGRLEKLLTARWGASAKLGRLVRHAHEHVRAAVRAYIRVRGPEPSVLPTDNTEGA